MSAPKASQQLAIDVNKIPVLIVEAAAFYASHLQQLLTERGCSCQIVRTVAEARSATEQGDYELVCIARHLPDGDGPELAEFYRNQPSTARVPLVMVTADESPAVFSEAYAAGFTEVFFRGELDRIREYFDFFVGSRQEERQLSGRVLYLEDTKWMATMTMRLLTGLGLTVDHFVSVRPALTAFAANHYDLVITDIILEGAESGVSLVREIRQMAGSQATIPILAVTAIEDASRRIDLFRAGVSDYICKPMINEELESRVCQLVTNKQLQEKVRQLEEQLSKTGDTDPLTGLPNRGSMSRVVADAANKARRTRSQLSIAIIGIDHFKRVNDEYGHGLGDAILQELGDLLSEFSKENAVQASRFGGDQYLLLFRSIDLEQTLQLLEQLREDIAVSKPAQEPITVTIGMAMYEGQSTFHRFINVAENALYHGKDAGRNRVSVGSSQP